LLYFFEKHHKYYVIFLLIFIFLGLPKGLIFGHIAFSFPIQEGWKICLLPPCQVYKNHEPRNMEVIFITLRISQINQKLVQEVWYPTKHHSFCILHDYCYESYWSFFFPTFPHQLARHNLSHEPCHIAINVLEHNAHVSSISAKLWFYQLNNFLLAHIVIQVLLWLFAKRR
jgi:hypothetical protein